MFRVRWRRSYQKDFRRAPDLTARRGNSACRAERSFPLPPEPTPGAGTMRQILSTLMSAFASSGQVNSWLSFKHLLQALQGKAGGTTVMTTVDHTLMRGLEPHDR